VAVAVPAVDEHVSAVASGLAVWPGSMLVAAGLAKAADVVRGDAGDTVLGRLVRRRRRLRAVWAIVAAAEAAVGALVLTEVAVPWPEAAAAALLGAAALLAAWGARHAPDAGCGCFGARSRARVSARTAVRAGLLAAFAAAAVAGGEAWTSVFDEPAAVAAVVVAGAAVAWLSPELRGRTLPSPVAPAVAAARRLPSAVCRGTSFERSVARLRRSELWRRARPYVAGDEPTEHWDEGCWRLICYPAVYDGEPATAVFAVSLGPRQSRNRVAFVDEVERRVLGRLDARRSRP
jgi:hypothetical protein